MSLSDIMIHIQPALSADARSFPEARIRPSDGVIAPRFNTTKEPLLLIAFDPDKNSRANLPGAVKSTGHAARRAGV